MKLEILHRLVNTFKESISTVTVEEIHYEFNSAGEKLYQEALLIINNTSMLEEERVKMLQDVGFCNLEEVKNSNIKVQVANTNKRLAELINYFRVTYPSYKFITKDKIIEICKKYNLVFGKNKYYIGKVPNKSLDEIYAFNNYFKNIIKEEDLQYIIEDRAFNDRVEISFNDYRYVYKHNAYCDKHFYIAAPEKDFIKSSDLEIKGSELVKKIVPDPVVFYPVRGGFLIVAAWGLEADDPEIKNEIKN